MALPGVSVVVPCRNEAQFLPRLLADLANQDYGGSLDVIVVDGESEDGSAEVVVRAAQSGGWRTECRSLRLVANPSQTIPSAMNRGVASASREIIVRIDAHATVPPDYVRKLVEVLVSGELDVVGPRKVFIAPNDTLVARCIACAVSSRIARGKTELSAKRNHIRKVKHAGLSCYFARTFWSVGGFDERLNTNEDFDFDYRCHLAGYRIGLRTDALFYSFSRATYGELVRQRFRYGYWKFQALTRRPQSLQPRQIAPVAVVCFLLVWFTALAVDRWLALLLSPGVLGYVAFSAASGLAVTGGELGVKGAFLTSIALMCVHLSWGAGFLVGVVGWLWSLLRNLKARAIERVV